MDIITLDFETYWDKDHSLSKMPPAEYVMHPKTEIISVSIKENDGETEVIFGEENIRKKFATIDWTKKMTVGHNLSGFDSLIMAWRFGIIPRLFICTMALARPLYAKVCGVSLAKLVEHLNLGVKDNTVLLETKGKRLADFTSDELARMRKYNGEDTDQCFKLLKHLLQSTSPKELILLHMTIMMTVDPKLELDFPMLEEALREERIRKRKVLIDLGYMLNVITDGMEEQLTSDDLLVEHIASVLASAPKFSGLMNKLGVETPMKASKTAKNEDGTAKMIPALAKTDQGFIDLMEHENDLVSMAAMARLSVKSTLLESRLEAFIRTGRICGGKLPVPLRFYGADTTGRWSGDQYNMQNLPRIGKVKKPSDALRMSLCAPKGKKIIVADLSGIELRVNHFLWRVRYSMELYKNDPQADLYSAAAVKEYRYTDISMVTKDQRQLEKVKALGLGFQAGWFTFKSVAKIMGGVILTDDQSMEAVRSWREQHPEIVKGWSVCQNSLEVMLQGGRVRLDPWGLVHTTYNGLELPSGRFIRYPDLRKEVNAETGYTEWKYGRGRHTAYIYGGKMDENIVQAIARDIIGDYAVDFYKLTRYMPSMMVHDELIYVVPEEDAEELLAQLQSVMRTPPVWWKELVTWSEGDVGDRYGEAK